MDDFELDMFQLAEGLLDEYGDDPKKLEDGINNACAEMAMDMEERIKVLLGAIERDS